MKTFKQFLDEILQQQPRSQLGSNPGGIYSDTDTGEKFYIKHYENPDQAKVETLTGKIYKHMGINTIDPEMHEGTAVKTKWNEHLGYADPRKDLMNPGKKQADQLARMYHGAVLTKNWDIVGLGYDNIMKHKNGNLYAVDHGGAFHFRAQGDHKEYTPDVNEKHSLVHNDNPSGRVFSELHANHPDAIKRSLETVKNIDMNHIHHLFKTSGLDNWQDLHDNFVKRRENLIGSYQHENV